MSVTPIGDRRRAYHSLNSTFDRVIRRSCCLGFYGMTPSVRARTSSDARQMATVGGNECRQTVVGGVLARPGRSVPGRPRAQRVVGGAGADSIRSRHCAGIARRSSRNGSSSRHVSVRARGGNWVSAAGGVGPGGRGIPPGGAHPPPPAGRTAPGTEVRPEPASASRRTCPRWRPRPDGSARHPGMRRRGC